MHIDSQGGKSQYSLHCTPGLEKFYDPSYSYEVRGLWVVTDYIYAVIGDKLYKVDYDGTGTQMSGTFAKTQGPVWMADNGIEIMIVEPESKGWIHNLSDESLTEITDTDFPSPLNVGFLDGYFTVIEADTFNLWISDQYDGLNWTAANYATAEKQMDNLLSQITVSGQLVLLGEKNTEVWYNSGATTFPLEVVASVDIGIYAPASVAKDKTSIFFLDDDLRVINSVGYQPQVISTPQIEYQLSQYKEVNLKAAQGYVYTQEGHTFYVLWIPSENTTMVYDKSTGFWHERQSFIIGYVGNFTRHRGSCHAKLKDKDIVGDFENGKLYQYKLDVYTDDGNAIRRRRTAQVIHEEQKMMYYHSLEIDYHSGVGLTTGQGSDPQAMLDWSNDGGHTFGNELWRSIGKKGEYGARAKWNRLGRSRNRVFRETCSDPVPAHIIGANLEASVGVNQ
jgi:hypothetical protein